MSAAQLKSIEDLRNYTQRLASMRPEDDPRLRKLQFAKQTTWLFLLVCIFLFYYLIDKMGHALTLL